jgi:hypothetical protein
MPTSILTSTIKDDAQLSVYQSLSFGATLHSLYINICVFERLLIWRHCGGGIYDTTKQ